MPYDPNQIMGLDALSPTVAAYKQFVERQNNVGDPNVVQFLASRGEPQLAGLIAKKMRVENAAKAQQQLAQQPQAAPPTVAQQYDQAAQQQAQQAMAAQMAQMQQARMAQAAPGLAGMPNPAMDRASFAGGGIVAFADGGDVQHFANQGLVNAIRSGGVNDLGNIGDPIYVNTAGEASLDPYSERWKLDAAQRSEIERIKQIAARKRAAEAAARNAGNTAAAETAAAEAAAAETALANAAIGTGSRLGASGLLGLGTKLFGAATVAAPMVEAGAEWLAAHPDTAVMRNLAAATENDPSVQLMSGWGVQPKETPRPAAPSSTATTQTIPSNTPTLAELQAKYARGQVPAPTSNRAAADSGRRAPAAPAAAGSQDLSNAIDIGEKPAAYASRPIDTTPYLNEQKFIEDQIKTKGLSEKEARSNFWIMAGASLLGSRDPNFATALGAAVKENYGNLIGDLRNIKKENDALALQKIKLDQAIAVAQHTQDEKDRERADTLMNAYQNRVVMRDKAILDSRDKALDRASAERRTTEMYGNRADAAKTTARNNQLRTIITTAESELGRLPGVKYPALMTPEAKARAAELQSTIDRARRELMSGGEDDEEGTGQSVTRTTKSGIPYIMEP